MQQAFQAHVLLSNFCFCSIPLPLNSSQSVHRYPPSRHTHCFNPQLCRLLSLSPLLLPLTFPLFRCIGTIIQVLSNVDCFVFFISNPFYLSAIPLAHIAIAHNLSRVPAQKLLVLSSNSTFLALRSFIPSMDSPDSLTEITWQSIVPYEERLDIRGDIYTKLRCMFVPFL